MRKFIVKCLVALSVSSTTLGSLASFPVWGAKLPPMATHYAKSNDHQKHHPKPKPHPKPHPTPIFPAPAPTTAPHQVKKRSAASGSSAKHPKADKSPIKTNQPKKAAQKLLSEKEEEKKESTRQKASHRGGSNTGKNTGGGGRIGSGSGSRSGSDSSGTQHPAPNVPPAITHARKVKLGKEIFFDTNLSNPGGISCATCHDPKKGFSNDHIMQGALGRFGNRRPPTIVVVKYNPAGPPHYSQDIQSYVGGFFWDGRSATAQEQPGGELGVLSNVVERGYPFWNPNEMNNLNADGSPNPEAIIFKILQGSYAGLFMEVYGDQAFNQPAASTFSFVVDALVAYEESDEVAAFTSKYDAVRTGKARFTAQEQRGFELFTGPALCSQCHNPSPNQTFSQFCYANIGVPRNLENPYYANINPNINPYGHNPLGSLFIDTGLGDFLKPVVGAPPTNGSMKVVTVRNVDKHHSYFHNASFISLKQVVHFYNKRNHTTMPGEIIDFTQPNPYAGLRGAPLFSAPEVLDPTTLINPQGLPASQGGQVGNLGLTNAEEDAIVAFLEVLSNGYFKP